MKKIIQLLLELLILCCSTPVFAQTTDVTSGKCGPESFWDYNIYTKELVIQGNGKIGEIKELFGKKIDTIVIKSGIEEIGNNTFKNLQISNLIIEEGLKKIGVNAFYGCDNLKIVTIPKSVTNIDAGAFSETALQKFVVLGDVVIGKLIFGNSNLPKTVAIAGRMENMADMAASYDARMPEIVLINNNPNYVIEKGLILTSDKKVLCALNGNVDINKLVIPSAVEKIMPNAAYMRAVSKLKLGKNVKTIGDYAFYKCNLKKVIISHNVITIGQGAFLQQSNLRTVKFNTKIKSIGREAFGDAEIKRIRFYNYPKFYNSTFDRNVTIETYRKKKISKSIVEVLINNKQQKYKITIIKKPDLRMKYKIIILRGTKKIEKMVKTSRNKNKSILSFKMNLKKKYSRQKIFVKIKNNGKWKKSRIL